jgi:hypothetical protein
MKNLLRRCRWLTLSARGQTGWEQRRLGPSARPGSETGATTKKQNGPDRYTQHRRRQGFGSADLHVSSNGKSKPWVRTGSGESKPNRDRKAGALRGPASTVVWTPTESSASSTNIAPNQNERKKFEPTNPMKGRSDRD